MKDHLTQVALGYQTLQDKKSQVSSNHQRVVSFADSNSSKPKSVQEEDEGEEENKLKALNDILKSGKQAFPMMRQEDEDEFEYFVSRLNSKNQLIAPKTSDSIDTTPLSSSRMQSQIKNGGSIYDAENVLSASCNQYQLPIPRDSSPFDADLTHITGTFEAEEERHSSPTKKGHKNQAAPPQVVTKLFQIRMKDQSALEYLEDEVQSIMSSASKQDLALNDIEGIKRVKPFESLSSTDHTNAREYKPVGHKEVSKFDSNKVLQILEEDEESQQLVSSNRYENRQYTESRYNMANRDGGPSDVRAKLLELEIEQEQSQKSLEMLKEVRVTERKELQTGMQRVREEAIKQAEEVRTQMADRIEKQLSTIEVLIQDKEKLSGKVEELYKQGKEREVIAEKLRNDQAEKFKREFKKEKEAWFASEKVRRERWESDKIKEIREGTVQKLEPTIQALIEKHKDEMRRADERHMNELRRAKDHIQADFEVKHSETREKLVHERDEALEKERSKL